MQVAGSPLGLLLALTYAIGIIPPTTQSMISLSNDAQITELSDNDQTIHLTDDNYSVELG